MAHKPRSGSLAFYPKVRANKHLANFTTYPANKGDETKAINFFGYKAGMTAVFGKDAHAKSSTFGLEVMVPATMIECPPLKIIGVRIYGKSHYGLKVLGEATIEKPGKNLRKKIKAFKKHGKKKKEEKKYSTFEDLNALKEKAVKVVLIAEIQAGETGIGKTKSDLSEVNLSGNINNQFSFAKEKFGKDLRANEVFSASEFIDVKAVDKGKGFQGPVKRAGIKVQRPKAKKHRVVGAISPWHPPTVMWTVARAGQLGYQSRTEYNKRILAVENNSELLAPPAGFQNYGVVMNDYIIVTGSVPGPAKRPISMRHGIRAIKETHAKYTDLKFSFSKYGKQETTKAEHKEKAKHVPAKVDAVPPHAGSAGHKHEAHEHKAEHAHKEAAHEVKHAHKAEAKGEAK